MKFDQIKQKSQQVLNDFFDVKGECLYGLTEEDTDIISTALAESLSGVTKNANKN